MCKGKNIAHSQICCLDEKKNGSNINEVCWTAFLNDTELFFVLRVHNGAHFERRDKKQMISFEQMSILVT